MKVPFLSFDKVNEQVSDEMTFAFQKVFDSKRYILGESVGEFERQYAHYNKVEYCVGLSNGLDALTLCLRTLDVGPGDEVIVPSNTYIASVLAVLHVGATPVFVEPDLTTYNINPAGIDAAISNRTKVILPVHLYGQACEMGQIKKIASTNGFYIVEDNAQAHGAAYDGKPTGAWGDVNAVSFYPGKNFGALGDAGAITTDNEIYAAKIKALRNYGSEKKYYNEYAGYNMRMDELQASFLLVKIKYIAAWTLERQQIASWYRTFLQGIGDIILPEVQALSTHVYHLFVIRTAYRDALEKHLNANSIGTLIHYPIPMHLQKAFEFLGYEKGSFPIAEEISNTCLSLPLYPGISMDEVEFVCGTIKAFFDQELLSK